MKSIEDKGCLSSTNKSFEFQNGSLSLASHNRTGLRKPGPSKWDDAQKWLVNLSRGGEKTEPKTKPRNSCADDLRLIAPVTQMETKNVDCEDLVWKINQGSDLNGVRSVCVRDMGTEMTPIASQEPSRAATPIRATTPVSSGTSTPVMESGPGPEPTESGTNVVITRLFPQDGEETEKTKKNMSALETRAIAWDEAERAKYMARYKREDVKIQAWENHETRKAELELQKIQVKAERLKTRAKEKYDNKIAATKRIAEEKRANAEAKLNEKALKTSEKADYIKRTGRLPFSLSVKLPSCYWCFW